MELEITKSKKNITIAHIAITLAVLGSSEPFNNIDVSPWVMIFGLGLLLVCYFVFRVIELIYIPKFHIGIACCSVLFWVAALCTCDFWSNIGGWNRLIYVIYPCFAVIFFLCLLLMNLVVFVIRWVQTKKMQG